MTDTLPSSPVHVLKYFYGHLVKKLRPFQETVSVGYIVTLVAEILEDLVGQSMIIITKDMGTPVIVRSASGTGAVILPDHIVIFNKFLDHLPVILSVTVTVEDKRC